MRTDRQDILLTPYALSRGFSVNSPLSFDVNGMPKGELQFTKGRHIVMETARGWRVASYKQHKTLKTTLDTYESPVDDDFFDKAKDALDEAVERHECDHGKAR